MLNMNWKLYTKILPLSFRQGRIKKLVSPWAKKVFYSAKFRVDLLVICKEDYARQSR